MTRAARLQPVAHQFPNQTFSGRKNLNIFEFFANLRSSFSGANSTRKLLSDSVTDS